MKYFLATFLLASTAHADFTFKYNLNGKQLHVTNSEKTWEKAFEKAAQQCYIFYTQNKPYSQEYGLDVIDVCANPR